MGPACKVVINQGTRAAARAIENILTSPLVRGKMIPESECDRLLHKFAEVDLAYYSGGEVPHGGLKGLLLELKELGALDDRVFELFVG